MIKTHTRLQSRDLKKFLPGLNPALIALGQSAEPAGIEPDLIELINLRVSQINGCAHCVQYHIDHLKKLGVTQEKMNLLVTWEEAGIFSAREEAAFAWAEALTLIAETHVPDATYEAARLVFSELELAGLTAAICAINSWNRIAVTFRHPLKSNRDTR